MRRQASSYVVRTICLRPALLDDGTTDGKTKCIRHLFLRAHVWESSHAYMMTALWMSEWGSPRTI
jgi:hypothetical protein